MSRGLTSQGLKALDTALASSGLVSTADDLWAFASMLAAGGGSLLSAESVALMTHDRMTAKDRAENRIFVGDHSGCFRFVRAATADQAGTGRFASDQ